MARSSYKMKTTSGEEVEYTYDEMYQIAEYFLKTNGNAMPTKKECEDAMVDFSSRFKKVVIKEETIEENGEEK